MAESRLEKLFGTKPKELPPIDEKTKETLTNLSKRVEEMVEKGKHFRETSKTKWGGMPSPGEPGWEDYFRNISHG